MGVPKLARSKYDMYSGQHVPRFDHFCGWLGTPIGEENYRYFLQQYAKYTHPIAETHAYCLMPNHVHFCIEVRGSQELEAAYQKQQRTKEAKNLKPSADWMQLNTSQQEKWLIHQFSHLFNEYTQAFNRRYNRRGNLFMTSFMSSAPSTTIPAVNMASWAAA